MGVVGAWFAYNVAITWLLPANQRLAFAMSNSRVANELAGVSEHSTLFCYGGYALAALLLCVGGLFCVVQHRKIRKQGTIIAELRTQIDPRRLSSRDGDRLLDYAMRTEDSDPPPERGLP